MIKNIIDPELYSQVMSSRFIFNPVNKSDDGITLERIIGLIPIELLNSIADYYSQGETVLADFFGSFIDF